MVFTGFRILFEAGGALGGRYFANNADGQYVGYQCACSNTIWAGDVGTNVKYKWI